MTTPKKKFLIINGPNLNMLGAREPELYGNMTLDQIKEYTQSEIKDKHCQLEWYQSNLEGEIVEQIQRASKQDFNALVINPGGYSHTSVAILDALKLLKIPIIEVHLTNTHTREEFRQVKITAKSSTILMEGLGKNSYLMAILSQLL
jgi:3-dehydroquinate dehydratase-2